MEATQAEPPRSRAPHLRVVPVESHDGTEEEEGEVEVVFQQVGELVVAVLLLAVLQAEAHAAHDAEAAAAVEQDVLEVKGARHQGFLEEEAGNKHFLNLSPPPDLQQPPHLPGVIRLQLDGGQGGKSGRKAHQLALHRGDAVENDAVGQNQSHERPAHRDQNGQTAVQPKDEGSVLWVEAGVRRAEPIRPLHTLP